jgi:hypothetical protein
MTMIDTNFSTDFADFANDNSFDDRLFQSSSIQFETGYLQNDRALQYLKKKQSNWNKILMGIVGATSLGFAGMPLVALFGGLGTALSIELSIPIDQVIKIMEMLLNEYGEEGITITPRIQTKEGLIDLIIKTADGRYFAFMLRSNGESKVRWREDRQEFFVVRKRGRPKWSGLNLLGDRLNDMVLSLKEDENHLVGDSKKQRKKGLIKAIVLVGKTTIDPNNDPQHLVAFGHATALKVCGTSTYFLINQKDLIKFLKKPD